MAATREHDLMIPPPGYKFIPRCEVVCGRAGIVFTNAFLIEIRTKNVLERGFAEHFDVTSQFWKNKQVVLNATISTAIDASPRIDVLSNWSCETASLSNTSRFCISDFWKRTAVVRIYHWTNLQKSYVETIKHWNKSFETFLFVQNSKFCSS